MDMSTSIWIKPNGVELEVDEGSAELATNMGWKRKEAAQDVTQAEEPKRKGRPKAQK
jgi:hypothetical protein